MLKSSVHPPLIEQLVTPVTPYFICNHFIATEIHSYSNKYINMKLNIKANDLLKHHNYNNIKNNDIIQVQVDFFDFFYDKVVPFLNKQNINIILITSQWHLPQIHKNHKTDSLVNNKNIRLWISQNPIYKHEKYMAFPYGISHHHITQYIDFINSYSTTKTIKVLNQYSSAHQHLPPDHIRKVYDIFGKQSGKSMNYHEFLTNLSNAEFVISTSGDRDDCYRHYECIGLHAIPISNINGAYEDIFGENMIYSNAKDMIQMMNTNTVPCTYKQPDRHMLTISYWVCKINDKLRLTT
jgi:hypothetical protein